MNQKLQLSVLCGGQSTEHEVSILSARNIVAALDTQKYDISVIFIDPKGGWHRIENTADFLQTTGAEILGSIKTIPITISLGDAKRPWLSLDNPQTRYPADCVFPVLHGTQGEDGTMQGLLTLLNIPYVGADAQSSAICMEKDVTKQLLRAANIPTVDWHTIYPEDVSEDISSEDISKDKLEHLYEQLSARWGKNLFIKPTSLGSSVCTTPVNDAKQFQAAVKKAFCHDERVIVEPRIYGREIECSVLGNGHPRASKPGEIILHHGFYSYEAKYIDPNGATTEAPAQLSLAIEKRIQQMAIDVFKATHCAGMARVDFFLVDNQHIFVNEINTIPGFTNISMYPKMWAASGLSYHNLLDELIQLALERHRYQQSLIRNYQA